MDQSLRSNFFKYVNLNVVSMVGLSCYILADTFFISKALGSTGLAALNLSIPIFSFLTGIGLMIGIGGATRFTILKARQEEKEANQIFSLSVKFALIMGMMFFIIGLFGTKILARLFGANQETYPHTKIYIQTVLLFAPVFIINHVLIAFVRNDHGPRLAMVAMLMGSIANIVLDYVFMFPLQLGMFGAALATSLAPVISVIIILIFHFGRRRNTFTYMKIKWETKPVLMISGLGLSSLITEVSSAIVMIVFNHVILRITGNLGVAAYSIVLNLALIAQSIYTGIAQGIQPLISHYHGIKRLNVIRRIRQLSFMTSTIFSIVIYLAMFIYTDMIVNIFNDEGNRQVASMAKEGLRIYFSGFFFAGINIVLAMILSAMEQKRDAFFMTMARGLIFIIPFVFIFSFLFDITGVWLSFVVTEGIVFIMGYYFVEKRRISKNYR